MHILLFFVVIFIFFIFLFQLIILFYLLFLSSAVSGASDKNVKLWKYSRDPRATAQAMSVKEIKELLAKHNISIRDCFEKVLHFPLVIVLHLFADFNVFHRLI